MTMKAKALKYRIRASTPLAADVPDGGADQAGGQPAGNPMDAFRERPTETPAANSGEPTGSFATDIAAIRREGLTGRQLRMARRMAQKNGLAPTSDFDAVRQLRERGIDPFQRANMLELVTEKTGDSEADAPSPAPGVSQATASPSVPAQPMPEDHRVYQIRAVREIQREIAQRRRRRLATLLARLTVFVLLPTFLTGWYFYVMATPMYSTKSEFLIQQSEGAGGSSIGGLFSGTSFATSQDSITVQSYLESREALLRLDNDIGFKAHFSHEDIDPLQRLDPDATNEAAYKLFKKQVTIGYDPTEGIVKMEVGAADPEVSAAFSRALIAYAEEQVDNLTQRLRGDQMRGARESFDEAEAKMIAAQDRVLALQEKLGVLDPTSESSALLGQVNRFETEVQEKRLELQQLLENLRPNQAHVRAVEGDISRLETLITELRNQLTGATENRDSLASIASQLRVAEVDLQTRTALMQQSLQQMESARIEANRQVRYLSLGVSPIAPDAATYPKSFINTLLAFLIFTGFYLMASLTVSILREQVSG
ncbi:MAG: capsule biosynthesis protein [Rhodobacteraceae bacterium]|nr:capsule biosynthesis protein [Paracoccaceae bacterium]